MIFPSKEGLNLEGKECFPSLSKNEIRIKEEGKGRQKKSCVVLLCGMTKSKSVFLYLLPRDGVHLPTSGLP